MKPAIPIVGGLALLVASATGFMLYNYLDTPPPVASVVVAPEKPKTVGVLVASIAIDIGRVIEPTMIEWQEWPEEVGRNIAGQGVITAPESERAGAQHIIEGAISRVAMLKGEPFTPERVVRRDSGSLLPMMLAAGHRSVTIPIETVSGVGGMVQPGDRVDIMLVQDVTNLTAQESGRLAEPVKGLHLRPRITTETIMTDMKVMATDRKLNPSVGADAVIPTSITFEVTPEQAERLATANRMGKFWISMRPLQSGPDPEREGPNFSTDIQVTPKTRAAMMNIALSALNLRENPFYPVPDEILPIEKPIIAEVVPLAKSEDVMVYRGTAQTVVKLINGKPVFDGPGSAAPPSTLTAPSSASLAKPATAAAVQKGPIAGTPAMPKPPADDSVYLGGKTLPRNVK